MPADNASLSDCEKSFTTESPAAPSPTALGVDRSIAGTLKNLANDLNQLFRSEIALVRAQTVERVFAFSREAIGVAIGLILALVGLIVFAEGLAFAVALWLPAWAAHVLTGIALLTTGGLVAWLAIARRSEVPRATPDAKLSDRPRPAKAG